MRKLIVLLTLFIVILGVTGAIEKYSPNIAEIFKSPTIQLPGERVKIVSEESVVIDIVEKITPSVVTVGVEQRIVDIDPFDPFSFFENPGSRQKEQDIGSGFIISADGLIVTNKHVVSSQAKYKVITSDGKKFDVTSVYRDLANDVAILKISPSTGSGLKPVKMGDSQKLKVGQLVVAVGTPLGEFRGTVTKGIISGIGRGIGVGSPFESYVEQLDNVIQTDAAINPGNSGGPLVNSSGQVIGVNTAVAIGAENIGFAIPINVIKDAVANFNKTGGFVRPYLGVAYQIVTREAAIRNELPQGDYIQQVVEGSSAEKGGIKKGDIITEFDGIKLTEKSKSLAELISKKKVGDTIEVKIWREDPSSKSSSGQGKFLDLTVTLGTAPNQ